MQSLYTVSTLETEAKPGEPRKILQQHFDQTRSLFVYLIWFLTEVARYAEKDAHQRASKHLPSAEDLNVNTKLAGNELLWKILEDPQFIAQVGKDKPVQRTDLELIRKVYLQLKDTPEYRAYIADATREKGDERKILEFIFNDLLLGSENFTSHIEELFSNWVDSHIFFS